MNRCIGAVCRAVVAVAALVMAQATCAYTIDTTSVSPSNVTGLWWNSSESGWGATMTQEANIIFVAMYTYDNSAVPVWYVVPNCPIVGGGCTGGLYRVQGGTAPTRSWAGAGVIATQVGTMTLAFSDVNNGTMTFTIDGVSGFKSITRQIFATGAPSPNDNIAKSQKLVGGAWSMTYTIISTFTDTFRFTSVDTTHPGTTGAYYAQGTDQFGGLVIGGYDPTATSWIILDPGVIIDQIYIFTFSDNNHVAGCYYQANPPGSTNLSNCYNLFGSRSPPQATKALTAAQRVNQEGDRAAEVGAGGGNPGADPVIVQRYLELRRLVQ